MCSLVVFFGCEAEADAVIEPLKYYVAESLPLSGSVRWDYLTFDPQLNRLFVTRGDHVDVLDMEHKKIVATLPGLAGVHGVALASDLNRAFVTEGQANRLTIVDTTSFTTLARITTGQKPDAVVYDTVTKRIFVMDADSQDITVIDAENYKSVDAGTIPLGADPEFAVADGAGHLYVNLASADQIAVIDTATLEVTKQIDLAPFCRGPTGLAVDAEYNRLFSTCKNNVMTIIATKGGQVIDVLPIGAHSDAAAYDPQTDLAFSSNGDGTLTIIGRRSDGHSEVLDTVSTLPSARTMALDPLSHKIYLAAAEEDGFDPPTDAHPEPRPHMKSDSFRLLTLSSTY